MFAQLPTAFPKLQAVVQAMDAVAVVSPPPIPAIGQRLRAAFERARAEMYRGLSIGELRKLPFAYWVPPAQPLPLTDPDLVQRYWAEALPQAIESGPRRAKRWLTPLFFTYCESFDLNDQWFSDFAKRVALAVGRSEGAFAAKLADLQRDLAFFQPNWVGPRLAGALLSNPRRLDDAFADHLLWPGFVDTPLGGHVFESALGLGGERLRDWPVIARLLDWAKRLASPVQKSRHRVAFADALLKPWYRKRPPDTVKSTLITFFVGAYGDPRMEGHRQYQWKGVAPEAISVLMGWLAGDTLRGFMRVLERTADEIWSFRRKFWMAFYDAGHIEEAWLALGSDARLVARKLLVDERGMGFGRLEGGAAPNQSVLLLKIGHLVFTEWSHNGSLRAYEDGERGTPKLYETEYHGTDLRAPISMDFHGGVNVNPELRHMNSTGGTWQRKARDFIRQQTGVFVSDREIL